MNTGIPVFTGMYRMHILLILNRQHYAFLEKDRDNIIFTRIFKCTPIYSLRNLLLSYIKSSFKMMTICLNNMHIQASCTSIITPNSVIIFKKKMVWARLNPSFCYSLSRISVYLNLLRSTFAAWLHLNWISPNL